jgi:hypothetical protein
MFQFQESSGLEKGVDSPGQDGSPPYTTPAASLSNGGASVDNVKPRNGPASSKQKPEMPSDVKQTEVSDEVISDDKEAPEPVTTEPEKRSSVSSKKSRKRTSTESKVTERSKVVSDNEGLVASGELSPETKVGNNKRTLETCNRAADDTSKPDDSTPAIDKPKRGRPPAVKSQEKKPVGKNQGSGLESKEVRSGSTPGGRPARRLTKDTKLSPRKTGEEEFSKKQPKRSSNPRKEDTLSDEDTDEDLNLKVIFSLPVATSRPIQVFAFAHKLCMGIVCSRVIFFLLCLFMVSCLCDFTKIDGCEATCHNLQHFVIL